MITRFLFLYNNNDLLNLCYYHLFCRGFMFSVCYLYLFTYMLVSNTISKSILFLSFYSSTVPLVEQELLPIPKHLSSLPVLVRFALLNNQFSVLCFIDHCLSFCLFTFGHCIVSPQIKASDIFKLFLVDIYRLWLLPLSIFMITINNIGGVMVSVLASRQIVGSNLNRVKPKTIQLVCVAFPY